MQMPVFKEGCVVIHRPTNLICKVIRWDRVDELLLVRPVRFPPDSDGTSTKPRERTRWVFEKSVVLVERTKKSGSSTASGGTLGRKMSPRATEIDLTEHARRSAKLDHRVEIREDRRHPERGRGLFAVQRVPAGTEVMRVRAVGAAVVSAHALCCQCFRRRKRVVLETCRNCDLFLCVACKASEREGRSHWKECEFARNAREFGKNPRVDECTLRLTADILARKKAGEIDDKDWDLLNTLRSDNNEADNIGLDTRHLQTVVGIFKDAMTMDVSEEDVQTMYRRVTRNAHAVTPGGPNTMSGDVLAFFPFGALVNHSCHPNSCYHSMAKASPRGLEVEFVLRTTLEVRAGNELCISYIANYAASSVALRRDLLENWGFQCACARCETEAEEEKHPEKYFTRRNQEGRKMLEKLTEMMELQRRSKLQFGPKEQRVLEDALRLTYPGEEAMSPTLCASLAMEAVGILDKESDDDMAMLAAFKPASDVLAEFRDPMAVGLLIKLHDHACAAMRERGVDHLRVGFCERVARDALANAVELCDLLYGNQHTFSILIRKAHQRGSLTPLRPGSRDK